MNIPNPLDNCYTQQSQCAYYEYNQLWGFNGTSAAQPLVAGVVAMLKNLNPSFDIFPDTERS